MPAPVTVESGQVRAGPVSAPVIPLLLIGIGSYLAWFGVHYWRGDLKWPSDPVKSVLQGKGLPPQKTPPSESAQLTADVAAYSGQSGSGYQGTLPAGSAQNTARLLLSSFGWGGDQMAALNRLWGTDESGWNPKARNASSGAFGIPQALGHGEADTAAPDGTNEYGAQYGLTAAEAQQANAGSARWQIQWGLGYIKDRYGSPDAALAFEQSHVPYWY